MEKTKRNPALKVIGAILIVAGVITFIVSAVQLYDVQTTTTHWAEGFMQDYQARTNATNSIPCYIFMALAVVMVIAGIVMVCIKPKNNVMVFPNMPVSYNNVGESVSLYCPNCKNPIGQNDIFCKTCGYNLKSTNQVSQMRITFQTAAKKMNPTAVFVLNAEVNYNKIQLKTPFR